MSVVRSGQQQGCTFCQKSQYDAKWLIASPDKLTYICDECTFEPNRLETVAHEPVGQKLNISPRPSRVFRFLWHGWLGLSRQGSRCSFCKKKVRSPNVFRSSTERETQAQICRDCLDVCRQILKQETKTGSSSGFNDDMNPIRIRTDFNGLFGELLCISHCESCSDEEGKPVVLRTGMKLTAFEEDQDDEGNRDDLIASGTVEPAPDSLRCIGSHWVLRLDANGVRHQSELTKNV